ncbi:unnamed protein product [Eretmochelys imbricata]
MLLNSGSVLQAPGGVLINGLALGDSQTITLSPVAPTPPVLLNGAALAGAKTPTGTGLESPPAASARPDIKAEAGESLPSLVFSPGTLEVKTEESQAVGALSEVPTFLPPAASDPKGVLLPAPASSVPQVVPSGEEAPCPAPALPQPVASGSQIVPLSHVVPSSQPGQALPVTSPPPAATPLLQGSPLLSFPALTSPIPGPAQAAPVPAVVHVPAPPLIPISQVSPPSQVVPLCQPAPGTPVLSPPQTVPLSPTQVYSVPQGAPAPQLLSVPQGSQLLSLPQVVPTSQVVTLQQGVGPIQILASAAPLKVGAPQAAGGAVGQSNVHLINANVGVTTLQLPAGAPGNFLLTNPVPGWRHHPHRHDAPAGQAHPDCHLPGHHAHVPGALRPRWQPGPAHQARNGASNSHQRPHPRARELRGCRGGPAGLGFWGGRCGWPPAWHPLELPPGGPGAVPAASAGSVARLGGHGDASGWHRGALRDGEGGGGGAGRHGAEWPPAARGRGAAAGQFRQRPPGSRGPRLGREGADPAAVGAGGGAPGLVRGSAGGGGSTGWDQGAASWGARSWPLHAFVAPSASDPNSQTSVDPRALAPDPAARGP